VARTPESWKAVGAALARMLELTMPETLAASAQLETAYARAAAHGISKAAIQRALYPNGPIFPELKTVSQLRPVECLIARLEAVRAQCGSTLSSEQRRPLDGAIAAYRQERDRPRRLDVEEFRQHDVGAQFAVDPPVVVPGRRYRANVVAVASERAACDVLFEWQPVHSARSHASHTSFLC
jgi:hypothetical protein